MPPVSERQTPGVLEKIVRELDPRHDLARLKHLHPEDWPVLDELITQFKPMLRGAVAGYLLGLLIAKAAGAEEAYAALLHPSITDTTIGYFVAPLFCAWLDGMQAHLRVNTLRVRSNYDRN